METGNNTASGDSIAVNHESNTDIFETVKSKKSSKRKRDMAEVEMESADTVAHKRPQFPPISGEKLKVTTFRFEITHK